MHDPQRYPVRRRATATLSATAVCLVMVWLPVLLTDGSGAGGEPGYEEFERVLGAIWMGLVFLLTTLITRSWLLRPRRGRYVVAAGQHAVHAVVLALGGATGLFAATGVDGRTFLRASWNPLAAGSLGASVGLLLAATVLTLGSVLAEVQGPRTGPDGSTGSTT